GADGLYPVGAPSEAQVLREGVGKCEIEAASLPCQQRLQTVIVLIEAVPEHVEVAVRYQRTRPVRANGVVVRYVVVEQFPAGVPAIARLEVHRPRQLLVDGQAPGVRPRLLVIVDV